MKKLIAGNWKMNGSKAANATLVQSICADIGSPKCDVAICVPTIYLEQVQTLLEQASNASSVIALGAQDVSQHASGAYTGDTAAGMLSEFNVHYCIVGHSERRQYQMETDIDVAIKARQALSVDITPIVCVGETLREYELGMTQFIVKRQLDALIHVLDRQIEKVVIAYEPVWAIGTGKTATPKQAQVVHAVLRAQLRNATDKADQIRILYGGSMKPNNALELLSQPDINGGLIGGAALKAADFLDIIAAA